MKQIKKHRNIIQLLEVIDEPQGKHKMYIVMELANSCTLHDLVDRAPENKLPVSQVQYFMRDLLEALQYIHGKNIVHRDIKPANCMLTTDFELKVADFGVAEFLNTYEAKDYVSRSSGSPAFQSPEIANGDQAYSGMKVDVWAAGVTLYYILTGKVPFEAPNIVSLFAKIGEADYEIPDDVDEQAADLLRHMMEKNFELRYSVRDCLSHPFIKSAPKEVRDDWIKPELREPMITKMISAMYDDVEPDSIPSGAQPSASAQNLTNEGAQTSVPETASRCTIV